MEQNYTSNVIKHHVIDKRGNSRVLLEEDLLLAFTRISPSALRSVRPVSIRPVSVRPGSLHILGNLIFVPLLSGLITSAPLFRYSCTPRRLISFSTASLEIFSPVFSPVFSPIFCLRLGKWPLRSLLFSGPILGAWMKSKGLSGRWVQEGGSYKTCSIFSIKYKWSESGRRKEGRKERKKEGKKERKKEGRKEGKKERRKKDWLRNTNKKVRTLKQTTRLKNILYINTAHKIKWNRWDRKAVS